LGTRWAALAMVQFDPEHLRIAAKLREQERQRWRKYAMDRALALVLICVSLIVWPLVLSMLLKWLW
jgi:hypothetical protein